MPVGFEIPDEILAALAANNKNNNRATILPEARIARIKEAADRFRPNSVLPFKTGDWVTPRKDSHYVGHGDPMLVIETIPDAEPKFTGSKSDPNFGMRPNLRILRMAEDHIVAFWVEAAYYEAYTGDGVET